MRKLVKKPQDALSGLMFIGIGVVTAYLSTEYRFGTPRNMGPGFFPTILAWLLIPLGAVLLARSMWGGRVDSHPASLRPPVLILSGLLAFSLLIRPAGLIAAIVAMVLLGAAASSDMRPAAAILVSIALALGSTVIFVYALNQPIPVLGHWFG